MIIRWNWLKVIKKTPGIRPASSKFDEHPEKYIGSRGCRYEELGPGKDGMRKQVSYLQVKARRQLKVCRAYRK
ncbi:hypothetical protein MSSIT_2695 [Methanosarcina siciliae T4/M]|uniref:Uncharacterized protein n=2 Tax=Methanosarcina siciliae TaxID=38027 RepID=A0A0E3PH09_9EURY|nr:hypothetical protein MSSIT_2695 [Methanosarcina siciliae T4/M]AKB33347.1 hypothetical protein MSSIH_2657 [Methanosarcina siciliae HI350]